MTPRAVELIRVSSRGQIRRDTPEDQRRHLDRRRADRPCVVVARIDLGVDVSGALDPERRPDIAQLRRLLASEAVDEVRVHRIDRLGRPTESTHIVRLLDILVSARVIVVDTAREYDLRTRHGLRALYDELDIAATERERIRDRTMDGRVRRAEEGAVVGTGPGYGYRRDGSGWRVEEEEAGVVRRIFASCVGGMSLYQIRDALAEAGVRSRTGRPRWHHSSVRWVLRAPAYRGEYVQRAGGTEYSVAVPAIVDADTWHLAQAALRGRDVSAGRRGHVRALCRGRIYCACGRPMYVQAPRATRYGYYYCRSLHRSDAGVCASARHHRLDDVDDTVYSIVRHAIEQPDLLAHATTEHDDTLRDASDQVTRFEREAARTIEDELRVADREARGVHSAEAAEQLLRAIRVQRERAQRDLAAARRRVEARSRLAIVAPDAVDELRGMLVDADYETRRRLVEAVVPATPGYGIVLDGAGRIELIGALPAAAPVPNLASGL